MAYPLSEPDDVIAERLGVAKHVPRDWRRREGIPSKYWLRIEAAGLARVSDLARYAASKAAASTKADAA